MRKMMAAMVVGVLALALMSGCESRLRRKAMQDVAKDWCQTIRASQVICSYPLSEDIQPGDVFLVLTPIQEQAKEYEARGFLRLDQLATRLSGGDYAAFYKAAYWDDSFAKAPHDRTPGEADGGNATAYWIANQHAPLVSFPSYSFTVNVSSGLKLALPVHGVPLGLNIMNAQEAEGNLAITDAFTYALPGDAVLRALKVWAGNPEVKAELARMKAGAADRLYLRAVNRVFLAGQVRVFLAKTKELAAGVSLGAEQGLNLMQVASAAVNATQYLQAANAMAAVTKEALPGAQIKYAHATRSSVNLSETFPRPLVVGYLGFDVEILAGGGLGPPVTTLGKLEQDTPGLAAVQPSESFNALHDAIQALSPGQRTVSTAYIARELGGDFARYGDPEKLKAQGAENDFWDDLRFYYSAGEENGSRRQWIMLLMQEALRQSR